MKTADTAEKVHGDGIGLGLSFAVTDGITVALPRLIAKMVGIIAERTVAEAALMSLKLVLLI